MGIFGRKQAASNVMFERGDDHVIDLTDSKITPRWGLPTSCPECGGYGYLDRIDVVHELMFQHCPNCWAKWETPRSDTVDY